MSDETPADRLRAAALRVREAWTRGRLVNEYGERCALGAILNAHMDTRRTRQTIEAVLADPVATDAAAVLHGYLSTTDGEHRERMFFNSWGVVEDIEEWNDGGGQTADHVAETMEKAAAAWEETPNA